MSSRFQRQLLLACLRRDGHACCWCGHPIQAHAWIRERMRRGQLVVGWRSATLEHVTERSRGGRDRLEDVAASCGPCNVEHSREGGLWRDRTPPKRTRLRQATEEEMAAGSLPLDTGLPWMVQDRPKESGLYFVFDSEHLGKKGIDPVRVVTIVVRDDRAWVVQPPALTPMPLGWWWCAWGSRETSGL